MIQKSHEQTHIPTYLTHNRFSQAQQSIIPPKIHVANGLQLIQCINYENNIFKKQQKYLQIQLNRLKNLTDSLLNENIQLRELYKGRTNDILNLIKTITLRTNENIIDYQHKSFLYTEMNCKILKQIKLFVAQIKALSLNIEQTSKEQESICQQTNFIEQQVLNKLKVKLKFAFNRQKMENSLQQEGQQSVNIHKIEQQINQLLSDNRKTELQLRNLKLIELKKFVNLKQERQEWGTKVQYIKDEIKNYREEINQDQRLLQKVNKQHQELEQKYRQNRNNLLEAIRKYQAKQMQYQQGISKRTVLANKLTNFNQNISKLQNQLDEVYQSKKKLQKQTMSAKERIKGIKRDQLTNIDEIRNLNKQNIITLKSNMNRNLKSYDDEKMKITNDYQKIILSIANQESQFNSLSDKIKEYKKILSQLSNPIGEIQKIELMMYLKNKK